MEITAWCIEKKLKLQFNQGLDIRRLDEEIARRLLKMPKHCMVNFAWDHIEDEAIIKGKLQLLKDVGFTKSQLRMHVQFYVYVDSDAEYQSGVYRCRELKKLGVNTYVMYNIDNEQTRRIKSLKRWSKGKVYFWLFDIAEFNGRVGAKTVNSRKAGAEN
jgi:hypothetical protein